MDNAWFIGGSIEPESWAYSLPYLIKTNTEGDTLWTKIMPDEGDAEHKDMIVDMAVVNDRLAVLASINGQMTISLLDKDGKVQWSYSNQMIENPVSIAVTPGNEIIACGSGRSEDVNDGRPSICLLTLDSGGKLLRSKFTGKGERIKPYSLAISPAGTILLSARRRMSGSYEAFLILLDPLGNEKDVISLSEFDVEYAFALQSDIAGSIFLTGEAKSRANPVLLKLDKEGKFVWKQVYDGTSGNFRSYDLSIQENGECILVGRTNEAQAFILSADNTGTLKEFHTYGGKEKAGFRSLACASENTWACAGSTLQGGNQSGIYAILVNGK